MPISSKNDRILVTLPKEIKAELKKLADKQFRSLPNYCASILIEHINKQKGINNK